MTRWSSQRRWNYELVSAKGVDAELTEAGREQTFGLASVLLERCVRLLVDLCFLTLRHTAGFYRLTGPRLGVACVRCILDGISALSGLREFTLWQLVRLGP